ncbi:MAG: phosphatidylcholine/phosphatidylserine synthase [Pacificimonas sp.]|nr:phosphatidylcholine/phosphatidylserine synthase [Pacificimonas sp.]
MSAPRAGELPVKRVLPIRALIPNAITVAALCAGLTAVRLAIEGNFALAGLAVVLAGVLDAMDGRVARMMKGATRFGAELDSLSDNAAFGVAPALIIYFFILNELPRFGWIIALAFAVCAALRLARFNAQLDMEDQPHKRHGFLTGVPAPVGAGLTLTPLYLYFWLEPLSYNINEPLLGAGFAAVVTGLSAFLMVSNVPTFSWKLMSPKRGLRIAALVFVAVYFTALITEPYMTLAMTSVLYVLTIPFSIYRYSKIRRREREAGATT